MPIRGREAKQPPRLHPILGSAAPCEEHASEAALRVNIPLRGREAKQPPRLHLILGPAQHCTEHVLEFVTHLLLRGKCMRIACAR
jgi:hypothetical protein